MSFIEKYIKNITQQCLCFVLRLLRDEIYQERSPSCLETFVCIQGITYASTQFPVITFLKMTSNLISMPHICRQLLFATVAFDSRSHVMFVLS